jgi:FkbM family methyltransferase
MATRSFLVEEQSYEVAGLSDQDPYLMGVTGHFEPKFQRFCSTLPPDAVALDIGANIGVTSIILGHYLPKGRVFALEPGKTIYGLLEQNLKDAGLDHVTPMNNAVSNQSQVLLFLEQSAYGHLVADAAPSSADDAGAVKAYSLDDLVDELKLDRLDFIKIDVEGFEQQVFEGARRTLARFKPVIYFELNSWCQLDHGKTNPIEFMEKIVSEFPAVYRVNKDPDSDVVLEKAAHEHVAQALVYANIVLHGSVDDIVVASDAAKLDPALFQPAAPSPDGVPAAEQQVTQPQTLEVVRAERDRLRHQLDLILNSRSWRYTRFLRRSGPSA